MARHTHRAPLALLLLLLLLLCGPPLHAQLTIRADFARDASGVRVSVGRVDEEPTAVAADGGLVSVAFSGAPSPGISVRIDRRTPGLQAVSSSARTPGARIRTTAPAGSHDFVLLDGAGASAPVTVVFSGMQTAALAVELRQRGAVTHAAAQIPATHVLAGTPFEGKDGLNLTVGANLDFLHGVEPKSAYFEASASLRSAFVDTREPDSTWRCRDRVWHRVKKKVTGFSIAYAQSRSATQSIPIDTVAVAVPADTLSLALPAGGDTLRLGPRVFISDAVEGGRIQLRAVQDGDTRVEGGTGTDTVAVVLAPQVRAARAQGKKHFENTVLAVDTYFPFATFCAGDFASDIKLVLRSELRQRKTIQEVALGDETAQQVISAEPRMRRSFGPSVLIDGKHVVLSYDVYWRDRDAYPYLASGHVYDKRTGLIVGGEAYGMGRGDEVYYSVYVARRFPIEKLLSLIDTGAGGD